MSLCTRAEIESAAWAQHSREPAPLLAEAVGWTISEDAPHAVHSKRLTRSQHRHVIQVVAAILGDECNVLCAAAEHRLSLAREAERVVGVVDCWRR